MTSRGMLGDIFSPTQRSLLEDEKQEEQVHQFQAADPFRAMAHASYSGGTLAGKGLASAGIAAAGGDPRSAGQRNVDAVNAAKAQVSALGFNPEDPKSVDQFYKQVIQILQKQGLAAEALAVSKEWNAAKIATAKEQLGNDKLALEKQELERKKARDSQIDARAAERNKILEKRFGQAASPMGKMLADMEREEDPAKRAYLKSAIENLAQHKIIVQDLGDKVQLVDAVTKEVLRTDDKALNPLNEAKAEDKKKDAEQAYGEYLAGLQRQYDAAVTLHNHPGVDGITGRFARLVGEEGTAGQIATTIASGPARAALALHKQVTGGTFLAGLAKLKAASKTGATGLGAVSEREGDKVQSDAAALSREQEAADYRRQLAVYIREMEAFAQRMAAAATADQIAPRQLSAKPLTAPKGGRAAAPAPAPAAAPAAPVAPKTVGEPRVRVRMNGVDGSVPASQLEQAKAAGAVEIK